MLDEREYLALQQRPAGRAVMRQRWRSLTFLHYSIEPEAIQATLPPGLTVDTYPDESGADRAWVGLVPFRMEGIHYEGRPEIAGCSAFPETNVRTYVHRDGKEPGVWFFSLDATNPVACVVARATFNLPYFAARMSVLKTKELAIYESRRLFHRRAITQDAALTAQISLGDDIALPTPGSLEFFLVERYVLYAYRRGALYTGQVSHSPYPLRSAAVDKISESMIAAAGLPSRPWRHVLHSDGVDVEVFPIRPAG